MTLATAQPDSQSRRYCVGCQSVREADEFSSSTNIRCKECSKAKAKSTAQQNRELTQQRAVNKLLEMVVREPDQVLTRSESARQIKEELGGQSVINKLYANKLMEVLNSDSANAKVKGLMALRALDADVDASKDQLKQGLSRLSDEELAQLGMALLTRALAAEGNYELLADLADQCGYELVPKTLGVVDGTAEEVACA